MTLTARARSGTYYATLLAMLILLVIPQLSLSERLIYVLAVALIYAVAGVGLDVFSGYAGLLGICAFAFMSIGAYIGGILVVNWEFGVWQTLPFCILGTGVVAYLLGAAMIRLGGLGVALGTFFLSFAVAVVLSGNWVADWTLGASGILMPPAMMGTTELYQGTGLYYMAWTILLIAVVISLRYVNSRAGKVLRVIKRSDVVAASMGIRVESAKLSAFVWFALTCGAAGFAYSQAIGIITPEAFPAMQSIIIMTMLIIGGMGSVAGAIIGAVVLQLLFEVTRNAQDARELMFALLVLIVLIVLPEGIYGLGERVAGRVRSALGGRARRDSLSDEPALAVGGTPLTAHVAEIGSESSVSAPTEIVGNLAVHALPAIEHRREDYANGPTALEVTSVGVRYGGVTALTDTSFRVPKRSIFAIIGPNGAGKTTLINCMSGIQRHTGQIRLSNEVLTGRRPADIRRLGVTRTFQHASLVGDLTAQENVELGCYGDSPTSPLRDILPLPGTFKRDRVARHRAAVALDLMEVPKSRRNSLAADLSLGEQRVVDIARALASEPTLLLLDEPTAGLAEHEMTMIGEALIKIREESEVTIVVIAHHIGFVRATADLALMLDFGKIMVQGTPDEVVAREDVQAAYLGRNHG